MKGFITSACLFFTFTILFYSAFLVLWGSNFIPDLLKGNLNYRIDGNFRLSLNEMKKVKDIDILFLGSSHAYRGFDTRIFEKHGKKVINLGSSAQTPIQTNVLLNRYLNHLNPKLIVYEVYPNIFSSDGVEASLIIIANDKNDIDSFKMAIDINNAKTYNTLLYTLLRNIFVNKSIYNYQAITGEDKYIKNGFVEKEMKYFKYINYEQNIWKFNEKQFIVFEKILSTLEKKGIKIVFVYAPITPNLYKSYSNNTEYDIIMNKYGEYYNFNTLLNLDDSLHFYDPDHLNQKGVEIFNNKLIEILMNNE